MKRRYSRFDIRHKETLTMFFKEYIELFFPDFADRIQFKTVKFLDKELISLFEKPGEKQEKKDVHRITDALVLIEIVLDGKPEQILIYWEQQSQKEKNFEERMFHCFCGIYFKFRQPIFPVAMFTDPAKWRKSVKSKFTMSLFQHAVAEFNYHLIKLKNYRAEEFEKKADKNPLAAAAILILA